MLYFTSVQETINPHDQEHVAYERPNGRVDVHQGYFKDQTFDSIEQLLASFENRERMANSISSGLEKISIPVVVFSALEAGIGIKDNNSQKVARGALGIGVGLGLKFVSGKLEKLADKLSVYKELLEDRLEKN